MFRFLPYVLKNLWRHRTRTLLTVSGSAVAIFVFCFVGAIQEGLGGLIHDPRAERTLLRFALNNAEDYRGLRYNGRTRTVNAVVNDPYICTEDHKLSTAIWRPEIFSSRVETTWDKSPEVTKAN